MRLLSGLILVIMLAACNLANAPVNDDIAIGVTVVSTNTPQATLTTIPTNTPVSTTVASQPQETSNNSCAVPDGWTTYTIQAGDTLFGIAQRANSTVDELVNSNCLESANVISTGQTLYVPETLSAPDVSAPATGANALYYWLSSANAINSSSLVHGCQTYITPIDSGLTRSNDAEANIRNALTALFNAPDTNPYQNYWNDFSLSVTSVDINNGRADIRIDGGNFLLVGACGDPDVIAQITMIVFAEPSVQTAMVIVNDMNLAQISDMSGRSGSDAVFRRENISLLN